MRRKELIDKIVKYLGVFVQEVKSYNVINNYDVNIHAENSLIPILNAIYEIDLVNANDKKKNYPSVDLIDIKNKVCFQVTSTPTIKKVTDTLEKFLNHNLHQEFSTLYVYILTDKESSYSQSKIDQLISGQFAFDANTQIIDHTDILKKVNGIIALDRLEIIARLFEHEFSNIQVETRKKLFVDGYLQNYPEPVFLNLMKVSFPSQLYIGEPNLDYNQVLADINSQRVKQGKGKIKKLIKEKAFSSTLRHNNVDARDWIMREDKIISFRNIGEQEEPLSKFIDQGTIEAFSPEQYFEISDDHLRSFKDLLRRCLIAFCSTKEMECINDRKILRFKNYNEVPRSRSTRWVGKKESTKTVIFEIMSKAKENQPSHIVCFRSMAFRPSFHQLSQQWFLSINPTWSFTNPGGYRASRFESSYMAGLKRMENNETVYYQFRFFSYYLSHTAPLFTDQYPYLNLHSIDPAMFSPKIDDSKWLPPKEFIASNLREGELNFDKELKKNMF